MDVQSYFDNINLRESLQYQNDVPLILAKHLFLANESNKNFVCSPVSFQIVLGMIAAGASGSTLDQLLGFLKFNSIEELNAVYSRIITSVFADGLPLGGPRLSVANGSWINQSLSFKDSFKLVMDNVYKAASASVDFMNKADEVADEVNQWAKEETNGLIKNLLPPGAVNSSVVLILTNALYFSGAWKNKFDASLTKDHEFHLLNGESIQAPFMTSKTKFTTGAAAYDGFKILRLDYKSGNDSRSFSMCFILPDAHNGLPTLLEKITSEPGFLNRHLSHKPAQVRRLLIPKFKITFEIEASKVLQGLGLTLPFKYGLTEIVNGNYPLQVSKVFHKSFIEVNEEGTEAAAATAVLMRFGASAMIPEEIDFIADHPFLFLVKDDVTGFVLFMGTVLNPLVV